MRRGFLLSLLLIPGLSGCFRGVEYDVGFLRGCWASSAFEGGPPTSMLRLIPTGEDVFEGVLQDLSAGERTAPRVFAFARNGRSLEVRGWDGEAGDARTYTAELLPPAALDALREGESAAAFDGGPAGWIVAAGNGEQLVIYALTPDGRMDGSIFHGDRDGCD